MNGNYFLDTNCFIYVFDAAAPVKREKATKLVANALSSGHGIISWQVCQEFLHASLHKPSSQVPQELIDDYLAHVLLPMCRVHSSASLICKALEIQRDTQYRFYDSLIVAAAIESGAKILYSEDLQHDRLIGHLRIVNPFI
jgi:predicted nucleic acid-binding protein